VAMGTTRRAVSRPRGLCFVPGHRALYAFGHSRPYPMNAKLLSRQWDPALVPVEPTTDRVRAHRRASPMIARLAM
ncbi:hypothetical protein, partial [Ferrimicrobium sp.]